MLASDDSGALPRVADAATRGAILRRRLVGNPMRSEAFPLGHLVRSDEGRLVGTSLVYPWRFVRGDRTLLGLGNGMLYVEPEARMQGFLLYRRYLGLKAADFWYATTCNPTSAALWSRTKGEPVPASQREFHLAIHAGPLAEEFALRKDMDGFLTVLAGLAGRIASPFMGPKKSGGARANVTEDWERVAAITTRNRDPQRIECERSADYLRWTYEGEGDRPSVHVFDTGGGREGWFSIGRRVRGRRGQIRDASLLDWSFPAELDWRLGIAAAIDTAIDLGDADMLSIEGRVGLAEELVSLGFRGRSYAAPTSYAISREMPSGDVAKALVIATADRF